MTTVFGSVALQRRKQFHSQPRELLGQGLAGELAVLMTLNMKWLLANRIQAQGKSLHVALPYGEFTDANGLRCRLDVSPGTVPVFPLF
jgi:hypothetical protein